MDNAGEYLLVVDPIASAHGIDILAIDGLCTEELPTKPTIELCVPSLIAPQTSLHPLLYTAGGEEDESAPILEVVVDLNKIVEDAIGELIGLIKDE